MWEVVSQKIFAETSLRDPFWLDCKTICLRFLWNGIPSESRSTGLFFNDVLFTFDSIWIKLAITHSTYRTIGVSTREKCLTRVHTVHPALEQDQATMRIYGKFMVCQIELKLIAFWDSVPVCDSNDPFAFSVLFRYFIVGSKQGKNGKMNVDDRKSRKSKSLNEFERSENSFHFLIW